MKVIKSILILLPVIPALLIAQTYQVGDIVDDYSFTDYTTGETVSLYELGEQGGVLVLEWFAWWCPFCANAAANVEEGIVEYYALRGGNPAGLPVRHIGLNVQGGARSQSDTFIARYGLETVMEDYNRDFFDLFSPNGGQPLFVIINAEANSPSAEQWEVLYTRLNYLGNEAPDISALMRPVIDGIEAGAPDATVETTFPGINNPTGNWYQSEWFGIFEGSNFPFISHMEFGYGYVESTSEPEVFYFYDTEWKWLFTSKGMYPFFYSFETDNWLIYSLGSMGEWFFDYNSMEWRNMPPGS
ncbi:hypothetical protein G0Q06_12720 [Puniceicoccales bacterium CK1056]|uniref:Thioredoxin domain-containing protein n=1 Tax=Oceanipulchritudo coccoides TaxID=2706888 RepID=A0A6B2M2S7_9BACT|nr:hypothetical protein [Oceanipulchritudo coccoides]NDV63321.1 hypothetical protein [Oceanipulchritudo coccoides]